MREWNAMRYAENIQDNEIVSYEVEIKNQRLILHTQTPEKKRVDIRFTDVYAHNFNNVRLTRNIIQNVETLEFPQFSALFQGEIPGWMKYGFPVSAENEAELEKKLKKEKLNLYAVNSSPGLSGIVFAQGFDIQAEHQ
jgi:hypothetical protein